MSARDELLLVLGKHKGALAQDILVQFAFAGYRVLGPDELDQVTIERCVREISCGCTGRCRSPSNCAREDVEALRSLPAHSPSEGRDA
jgi:hypothetical protein